MKKMIAFCFAGALMTLSPAFAQEKKDNDKMADDKMSKSDKMSKKKKKAKKDKSGKMDHDKMENGKMDKK